MQIIKRSAESIIIYGKIRVFSSKKEIFKSKMPLRIGSPAEYRFRAGTKKQRYLLRELALLVVVSGGGHTSIGLRNAYYTVVFVVGVRRYSSRPVGDANEITVFVIRIRYRRIVGVNELRKISDRVVLVTNDLAVGVGVYVIGTCF